MVFDCEPKNSALYLKHHTKRYVMSASDHGKKGKARQYSSRLVVGVSRHHTGGKGKVLVSKGLVKRQSSKKPEPEQSDPTALQQAAVVRMNNAIESYIVNTPSDVLVDAMESPTDMGALIRFVSKMHLPDEVSKLDPLAGSVKRSIEHRRVLKEAAGEFLSLPQVSDLIGKSQHEVADLQNQGSLLAMKISSQRSIRFDSGWIYPALQFTNGSLDPLMEQLVKFHNDNDPWVILDILLAKDSSFGGRSLLDLVRQQDREAIDSYLHQVGADGFG